MATHKELSNFTHDRLSKCNHIDLEIAELKASLTVKQSNQLVPQAIFDKIKDLCIKPVSYTHLTLPTNSLV